MKSVIFCILILISYSSYAGRCIDNNTPLCPEKGSTVLPETYPASAYVVSTRTDRFTKAGQSMPESFITEVMDGYNFDINQMPTFYIPTSRYSFDELTVKLREKLSKKGLKSKKIDQLVSNLAYVDANSYMWQQDYMQSTFNAETGKPVTRVVSRYSRTPVGVNARMEKSERDCAPERGAPLGFARKLRQGHTDIGFPDQFGKPGKTGGGFGGEFDVPKLPQEEQWIEGHPGDPGSKAGGNIEALPGGICLTGTNQSDEYTKEWCSDLDYAVKVDVDWLSVGHVDEVVKLVPNGKSNVPCNFSIMIASPKKAIELLKEDAAESVFDLSDIPSKDLDNSLNSRFTREFFGPGKIFCKLYVTDIRKELFKKIESPKVKGVETAFKILLGENAFADSSDYNVDYKVCDREKTKMKAITNGQFSKALMKDDELRITNELIQEKMDKAKRDIAAQLSKHLPQCGSPDFIDVPDLFFTDGLVDGSNGKELPLPGSGDSIFPNPTNSVVAGNKIIFSDPENSTFKAYQKRELEKRKARVSFVDTWDTSHLAKGNLHCITNSQRYCKPRSNK